MHKGSSLNPKGSILLFLFRLSVSQVGHVGTAQLVPVVKEGAIVALIVGMVVVVDLAARPKGKIPEGHEPQVVAGMPIDCFSQPHSQPNV